MSKEKLLNFPVPKGWRKGQTIFNFLWWLREHKLFNSELVGWGEKMELEFAKGRMADPFNIPDTQLEALYAEFLAEHT